MGFPNETRSKRRCRGAAASATPPERSGIPVARSCWAVKHPQRAVLSGKPSPLADTLESATRISGCAETLGAGDSLAPSLCVPRLPSVSAKRFPADKTSKVSPNPTCVPSGSARNRSARGSVPRLAGHAGRSEAVRRSSARRSARLGLTSPSAPPSSLTPLYGHRSPSLRFAQESGLAHGLLCASPRRPIPVTESDSLAFAGSHFAVLTSGWKGDGCTDGPPRQPGRAAATDQEYGAFRSALPRIRAGRPHGLAFPTPHHLVQPCWKRGGSRGCRRGRRGSSRCGSRTRSPWRGRSSRRRK